MTDEDFMIFKKSVDVIRNYSNRIDIFSLFELKSAYYKREWDIPDIVINIRYKSFFEYLFLRTAWSSRFMQFFNGLALLIHKSGIGGKDLLQG